MEHQGGKGGQVSHPLAAFCGMIFWIQRIVHAIQDARWQRYPEAQEKDPSIR
jgi:hypothetical protein